MSDERFRLRVHDGSPRDFFDALHPPTGQEYRFEWDGAYAAEWPEGAEINDFSTLAQLKKGDVVEVDGRQFVVDSNDGHCVKLSLKPE